MNLDALLNAADSAKAVGVSKQLLNHWRNVGKLTPARYTSSGRALYRFGDVLKVEAETSQSKYSSRT